MLKGFSKYIGIIVIAILVLYIGYAVGMGAKLYLEKWKMAKKVELFNNTIIDMFKNDTYGGKTPEETYNLFVAALKKQDVDLAVKYFILDPERRARYKEDFEEMNNSGKLKGYGEKLPEWSKWEQIKDNYNDWESQAKVEHKSYYSTTEIVDLPDGKGGYIKTELPPGNYVDYSMVFTKNIDIWKISSF
jgi:hypothetical protein